MSFCYSAELANDLEALFHNSDEYDLVITCGQNDEVEDIGAHSLLLRARCAYFRTALSKKWQERENGIIKFSKPNIAPRIIKIILRYLYTGLFRIDTLPSEDLLELLTASDELGLSTIFNETEMYLTEKRHEWLLQNLVPLMNPGEYFTKVRVPYKALLSPELDEEILQYFHISNFKPSFNVLPKRHGSIDSTIIGFRHSSLIYSTISKSIDKPFRFNLLFRASLHGFQPNVFHSRCDFANKTIVVGKIVGSKDIIGGYNPVSWSQGTQLLFTTSCGPYEELWPSLRYYRFAMDSFLFAFKDGEKDQYRISRVNAATQAILCTPSYGPSFGESDLIIADRRGWCMPKSYEKLLGQTGVFMLEDYEVFEVIV
ncbi:2017_t:CDS:2 [Paraglomus occultum]|uniref:2017_t:CDS:1 n=1 Tax=Paraglomus occultum TaxID=144539 RepID=A0A9N8Z7A9_9GLOM|nr:2017_t:CDS:2 [Paraglomus occultum]